MNLTQFWRCIKPSLSLLQASLSLAFSSSCLTSSLACRLNHQWCMCQSISTRLLHTATRQRGSTTLYTHAHTLCIMSKYRNLFAYVDQECSYPSNWRDQTTCDAPPHEHPPHSLQPDWTQTVWIKQTQRWSEGEGGKGSSGLRVKAKAQATRDWSWGAAAREGRSVIRRRWHTVTSPCCDWNTAQAEELAALLSAVQRSLSYRSRPYGQLWISCVFCQWPEMFSHSWWAIKVDCVHVYLRTGWPPLASTESGSRSDLIDKRLPFWAYW